MLRTTQSRFVAVLFLFGLEKVLLSPLGHCAGNQCFALFRESTDFSGAESRCRNSMGEILTFRKDQALAILDEISGRLWLRREEAEAGFQKCSSISVMNKSLTHLTTPCGDKLDGFLCQYKLEDPCSRLQVAVGAQLRYVAHGGFEVYNSETFPQGTVAVVEKADGQYLASKHLCFDKSWLSAPWRCEVMNGGCEHRCNDKTNTCLCPVRQSLHSNNVTCSKDPCKDCAHTCQQDGDSYLCTCKKGYRLAPDRKSCVDVDECAEEEVCKGDGRECENIPGGYTCGCMDGFVEEEEECVNVTICEKCEHLKCEKLNKVYECVCREGFRVSPNDPTKCEKHCTERDCNATCIPDPEVKRDMLKCFCPNGYIKDVRNTTTICTDIDECEIARQCDHKCENSFGGYRCLCDRGYYLHNKHTCLPLDEEAEDDGSGSFSSAPTPVGAYPAGMPSYIKTGSVMGITVFLLLCTALLIILARNLFKRCGKFELPSFKTPDIDIFYLQQVTTDTYKRLSFDKEFKSEQQKV